MSLLAIAASAVLAMSGQPDHTVTLDHRGDTYQIAYRPHIETRVRTIGIGVGPRPSPQRCVASALVRVERIIAKPTGDHELKTVLPRTKTFTHYLPGACDKYEGGSQDLLASKAGAIRGHLSQAAAADRPAALATIDAAHHFAGR